MDESFRYELRSGEQFDRMAQSALLPGTSALEARPSTHRDLYLDTTDGVLRAQGASCRIRVDSSEVCLSVRIGDGTSIRATMPVPGADIAALLPAVFTQRNPATLHLRSIVDPARLTVQLELDVERVTHGLLPDLFRRPRVEVHVDRITVRNGGGPRRELFQLCGHRRRGEVQLMKQLARALEAEHDLRVQMESPRDHLELLLRWTRGEEGEKVSLASENSTSARPEPAETSRLSPELSLLAFQRRVLAVARNPATPLRERLRFLGIVTSNVDEFYMVRMAALRRAARQAHSGSIAGAGDPRQPVNLLASVRAELSDIAREQALCASACLREASDVGTRLRSWSSLTDKERELLRVRCRDELYPALTPLAMTLSPGHPLPHLPHLGLSLAVVFRREKGGIPHLSELELPSDAPRLVRIPGQSLDVITIEELLRGNLALLHPNVMVESAHLFRVTRGGDLALDEAVAEDLLDAVAVATEQRPLNPAVRVEVEPTMPSFVTELVVENLRRDAATKAEALDIQDVEIVEGLLDLRCLADLPLPNSERMEFAPHIPRSPVSTDGTMFDVIRDHELMVHHPFEGFEETVVRFIEEAAADQAVTTIRITLYRVGERSPVVEALLHAAAAGKRVVAFVELKARFDEEHNVHWARALERAGGNVVYGLVGLKTHAKVAMVVRREGARLQRYVHVGTGNYNVRSGRQYTDLSLFSARESLADDVSDLFNELTGSSRPPQGLANGALVAPHQLLPAVIALIDREASHARAGRAASISIKVNGLSDPDVMTSLYSAARAGVQVKLIVRGICTLDPGRADLHGRLQVVSVVGRFLEHSRIYRFENDGAPAYLIGSSDLRPRNLRRRVELLVPVLDSNHQSRLDRILALYLDDSTAWELHAGGRYQQRAANGMSAQELLMQGADCESSTGERHVAHHS